MVSSFQKPTQINSANTRHKHNLPPLLELNPDICYPPYNSTRDGTERNGRAKQQQSANAKLGRDRKGNIAAIRIYQAVPQHSLQMDEAAGV